MNSNIVFFLFSCFLFTHGMILVFPGGSDSNSRVEIGDTKFWWTSIYSKSDSPYGNSEPYVSFQFWLTRDLVEKSGHLEILIYDSERAQYVGIWALDNKTIEYCCIPKLDCKMGNAIFKEETGLDAFEVWFEKGNASAFVQKLVPVSKTGVYLLQISNCEGNGLGGVVLRGSAIWRNPYGYLPGDEYMRLTATGVLALCNLFVLIAFVVLCIKYRHLLMSHQKGILGLLMFEILESASWYFYKIGLNNSGYYNITALLFLVFLTNAKKTAARILVLLISMGFGTVKWDFAPNRMKVAYLSVFYMFFAFLYQMIREVETLEKRKILSEWVELLVVIPTAISETIFYYWIILSLIRTTQQLTLRRQVLKLQMYKSFFGVLIVVGVLACIAILYQLYYKFSQKEIPWQRTWVVDAYWDFLFFIVVVAIAFLWRPRENNSRYGYAEFFTDQESPQGDDNQIPLETININGELTHRKKVEKKTEERTVINDNLTDFERNLLSLDLNDENDEVSLETEVKKMD